MGKFNTPRVLSFLLFFLVSNNVYSQQLVAYYPFNGNADDESGNGNNAVQVNANLTNDRFNNSNSAYQFDGVDDFIHLPGAFSDNQTEGSVSIWVQFDDELDDYNVIAKGPNDFRIQYSQSNDDIYFSLNSENGSDRDYTDSNLDWTKWNHIVITWDESSKSVYLNGQQDYNISNSFSIASDIGDVYLGRNGGIGTDDYEFLKGKMDDLRWFNSKINEADVQVLFNEGGWQGNPNNNAPIAYYPFNGNADDESGNGNDGVIDGATITDDRFGNSESSYDFDGIDDFLNLGDLRISDNQLSMNIWAQLDDITRRTPFFDKHDEFHFLYKDNALVVYLASVGTFTVPYEVDLNDWNLYSFTYNNESVNIYVNAELVGSFNATGIINDSSYPLYVASDETAQFDYLDGKIDDVRIFDQAISPNELIELFNENGWQGNPLNDNPVAHYTFDGNVIDVSGNGNDGTVEGATFTNDRFGNSDEAIYFDGIDDYVRIDHSSELSPLEEMSISVFVKIDDLTQDHGKILSKKNYGGYSLDINRPTGQMFGQFAFQSGDAEVRFDNSIMEEGIWHHLVLNYDGEFVRYYLDGIEKVSLAKSGTLYTNTECLLLAAEVEENCTLQNDQFGQLTMDDLRIFDRALSESEITELSKEGEDDNNIDGSLAFGPLNFTANEIEEIGDNTYQLNGNIKLEENLEFNGTLIVNTSTLTIEGNGAVFLSNIPEFGTIDIYEGNIFFTLTDGESRIIEANTLLGAYTGFEVAGFTVGLETIEILDDGVKIVGLLDLPEFFKVNAKFETLQITKSNGLDLIGEIGVENVRIAGGATMKEFTIAYDTIEEIIEGHAEVDTRLIDVEANAKLIEGKLDRIGVVISSNKNIPIGNTGLGLAGGGGEIGGLRDKENRYVQVETVIVPILPGVDDIIQLDDLTFRYDFGRSFSAYGNLSIFNRELSDAELVAKRNNISFTGGVNFSDILIGSTGLGVTKTDETLLLNGNLDGILQIPDGDGFPFGIIEVILGELPYEVGSTTNSIDNYGIRGSTDIQNLNMDYSLEWQDGDLDANFAVNMRLLNGDLFAKSRLEALQSKAVNENVFEGRSLIINPQDPIYNNKRSFSNVIETFKIEVAYPTLVVRLEGTSAPDFSLINPLGESINTENVDQLNNVDFYKNEKRNRSYYLIKSPSTGEWSVEIPDDQEYELDVIGSGTPPSIQFEIEEFEDVKSKSIQSTSSSFNINWSANDPDSDALISFYYDENNKDNNGTLIEGSIEENNGNGTVIWDTSNLGTGEYYVYAKIEDGEVSPRYVYLDKQIGLTNEGAPVPPNNPRVEVQDTLVTILWDEVDLSNSYSIYYSLDGVVNYNSDYISAIDSSITVDSLFAAGKAYSIAISSVDSAGVEGELSEVITFDYISESRNNEPFIQEYDGANQVKVNEEYLAQIKAIDQDQDELRFNLVGEPENMSIDNSGLISWVPTEDQVGRFNFKVLVSDNIATDSISLSVIAVDSLTSTGRLSFLTTSFSDVDIPYGLTLRDINLNTDDSVIDSAAISLTSNTQEEGFGVYLYETSSKSGVFEGTIELTDEVTNLIEGLISINDIDTLYAVYQDDFPTGMRIASAFISPTLVSNEENEYEDTIPEIFELYQNYPNPFNPVTQISYALSKASFVEIEIRNILGQLVSTLVSEQLNAGRHSVNFDASKLSSGVYFYTIVAGDFNQTKKMLLIK